MSNSTSQIGIKSIFYKRDFSKLWLGQLISNTGSMITIIILPLFIYEYSKSYFWLTAVTFAQLIPVILFSSFAGVFVDTHNRKYIMIVSDFLNSVLVILIPVIMTFASILNQTVFYISIFLLVFLGATVNRFFYPARFASIPHLVTDEEVGTAVSITQTTQNIIGVLGPMIGVLIATIAGYNYGFLVDGLTFMFSACMIAFIKTNLKPIEKSTKLPEKPSLLLGLKKIWSIKTIRYILIINGIAFLCIASVNQFLVVFVKDTLNMPDYVFGTTIAFTAGSAIIASMIITKFISKIHNPILFLTTGLFLASITLLPFLFITQTWQLYVLYFLIGIFNMMVVIPRNIILLRDTTDSIRGQVTSSFNMVFSLDYIVGLLYGLLFISIIGIRLLFFINGLIITLITITGFLYLFSRDHLQTIQVQKEELIQTTVNL